MDTVIRENREEYMRSLREWLRETENNAPEEMSRFFEERIEGYEEHMSLWQKAYERFAELLPASCREILDLGCGTGLEIGEIWKRDPGVAVTGIDLCRSMLDRLQKKYGQGPLTVICGDYLKCDLGRDRWDAVISFESLHHFLPGQKLLLYRRIWESLRDGGEFLLGDYIACCPQEEELLREACLKKRERFQILEDEYVHFDIPLTEEHEIRLLNQAGFFEVSVTDSIEGATILRAERRRR